MTSTYANSLSVIDLGEWKIIATVETGSGPSGVSMKAPAGH